MWTSTRVKEDNSHRLPEMEVRDKSEMSSRALQVTGMEVPENCQQFPTLSSPYSKDLPVPQTRAQVYVFKQHIAALLASLPLLSAGMAMGWSAPAVPVLLGQVEDAQPLRLSLEQCSWLVSVVALTSLPGAMAAGPLAERIGRKGALLAVAAPWLLANLLTTFAGSSIHMLFAGRVIAGVAVGASHGSNGLYCEEIADVRIRGALGSYQYMICSAGFAVIYALGAVLPYFWFTAAGIIPPAIFVLTFCWMPESPAYLAARGRRKDAHRSLRWLRGPDTDSDLELETLLASRTRPSESSEPPPSASSILCTLKPWRSTTLRGLAILMALMLFQQGSGAALIAFYTVQVFQEAGGSIASHVACLIAGVANFLAAWLAIITIDRAGRRVLLLTSAFTMTFSFGVLSIYSLLKIHSYNVEQWTWIPLFSVLAYCVSFGIAFGPIPWFMTAELLPMHAKGWASPIVGCVNKIVMFLVAKQSPIMLENAGEGATYAMFCCICLIAAVFVFFCVPETKGKTKTDILNEIGGDNP